MTEGYTRIRVNGKLLREHRLVYEQHHKCCLLSYADIHHINGNKLDNRIENLELISHSKHLSLHKNVDYSSRKCVDCGSTKSIIHSRHKKPVWYYKIKGKPESGFICNICYFWRRSNS